MDNNSLQIVEKINQNSVLNDLTLRFGGDERAATQFRNTVISIVLNNEKLQKCSAQSILTAAYNSIALNLSISPQLGYVYIVPYGKEAKLQIGYKGQIQLALRSGQYHSFNACIIYEGMIILHDFITDEFVFGDKTSDKIVGYIAHFRLLNGFEKYLYMTVDEVKQHAEKFSRAYANDKESGTNNTLWSTDFDKMACKTVLKLLLSKYGPASTEAISADVNDYDFDDSAQF